MKLIFGLGIGLVIGAILPYVFGKVSRPGPVVKELPAWSGHGDAPGTARTPRRPWLRHGCLQPRPLRCTGAAVRVSAPAPAILLPQPPQVDDARPTALTEPAWLPPPIARCSGSALRIHRPQRIPSVGGLHESARQPCRLSRPRPTEYMPRNGTCRPTTATIRPRNIAIATRGTITAGTPSRPPGSPRRSGQRIFARHPLRQRRQHVSARRGPGQSAHAVGTRGPAATYTDPQSRSRALLGLTVRLPHLLSGRAMTALDRAIIKAFHRPTSRSGTAVAEPPAAAAGTRLR